MEPPIDVLKKQTRLHFYHQVMDDERRHRMEDRERVRQVIRDQLRDGKVMTWRKDDPPPQTLWERIKRTIKKTIG